MIIPFGIVSMLIQGGIWSVVYERLFSGETILKGALKFSFFGVPLGMELHGSCRQRETPNVVC